jgi:hypothetical protein
MLSFEAVAAALVDARSAWLAEPAIAAALGCAEVELAAAVAGLVAGRLLERWDRPDGPVVTLTGLGAAQLGLRLVELPDSELYRWSADAVSVRTRRISRAQRRRTDDHAELLDQVVDEAVGPAAAAERSEAIAKPRPDRERRKPPEPRPAILLWGHGLWPWDEVGWPRPPTWCRACAPRFLRRGRVEFASSCRSCGRGRRRPRLDHCPACRGRRLSPATYCLRCDRWGLDGYFGRRLGRKTVRPEPRKAG